MRSFLWLVFGIMLFVLSPNQRVFGQAKKALLKEPSFPPKLADGKETVSDTAADFLKPTTPLKEGVTIARAVPTIDFAYIPGQDYVGKPWSNWGDSIFVNGKYYLSVGDHLAPAGNAFVYEYDPSKKVFRKLLDVKALLNLPEGHYVPGKIHSRLEMGSDGWLYCATHRGSTRVTTDQYHFKGDWLLRVHPETGKSEIVAHGPVPKHCIPTGLLDPQRLIFYGSTVPGSSEGEGIHFFAYDLRKGKLLCDVEDGPSRAMMLARSTGRLYYVAAKSRSLMLYDPSKGGDPVAIPGTIGLRAASDETKDGLIYTVSQPGKGEEAMLYCFNTRSEKIQEIGPAQVGSQSYITTLDIDPTGRYLYYVPGAHGGSHRDGTPIVQYDVRTKTRKVLAFLQPFYQAKYGCSLQGTYSVALSDSGDRLFITWNANRGSKVWDTCALTVIHIPAEERKP